MANETRTLPLTPAMRAALAERTTGMFQRGLPWLLGIFIAMIVIIGIGAIVENMPFRLAFSVPIFIIGGVLFIAGFVAAYERRKSDLAMRAGIYTAHNAFYRVSEFTHRSQASYTLHADGHRLAINLDALLDLDGLKAADGGTVLFVPGAKYLLAAWDWDGNLLYTAPDYDLRGDPDAARPAAAEAPRPILPPLPRMAAWAVTEDEPLPIEEALDFVARVVALSDLLTRHSGAMIALGAAMILLSIGMILSLIAEATW